LTSPAAGAGAGAEERSAPHTLPARLAAAGALRRLNHAVVAHDVDDHTFARLTADAERWEAELAATPDRTQAPLDLTKGAFLTPPPDGGDRSNFPDCLVSGKANPMGLAADLSREGDEALLRATLGPAFEGAPGRAHGGVVAALLDEVMGFVLSIHATPAYTGQLTVTYRAPTPIGVELELRARLRSRHGRKLRIEGRARCGETVVAEAEALFVAVEPEHFAAGRGKRGA